MRRRERKLGTLHAADAERDRDGLRVMIAGYPHLRGSARLGITRAGNMALGNTAVLVITIPVFYPEITPAATRGGTDRPDRLRRAARRLDAGDRRRLNG